MVKKLEVFLFDRLARHAFEDDHEKYLFLISYAACIYAATMHVFLLFFYLAVNIMPLFFICLGGVLIDALLLKLIEKGYYPLFGLLLSGIVIVVTITSAIYVGVNNFVIVYLLVTLMMQIIIPYANNRVRAIVIVALWACMIALVAINCNMTPLRDIGDANTVLALFNLHLAFFGTGIQLTIGNVIWGTIIKFNRAELEKSKDEANTDPLTGLFNRRFASTFFSMLRSGQHEQLWCVAMLDIDDFKVINDTYGHPVGDGVLTWLSDTVKSSLRKTDLVFRWGGEEFLILLKDVEVSTAFRILDKLRSKIESEDIETLGKILRVTVTIGVCPLDIHNVEHSIGTCDRLMYEGKSSGKNVVVM